MVKVTYSNALGNYGQLEQIYDIDSLDLARGSASRATYEDDDGDRIVFTGHDLKYRNGNLRAGTVEGVQFLDSDGNPLLSITGGNFDAKSAYGALHGDLGIRDLFMFVYAGNDKFVGSDKSDIIYGAGGDDRLTGGKGNDWFLFGHGDGHDVITDFDANGGDGKQDLIRPFSDDYKVRADGDNTIIDFGNGDTLTLLNVKKGEISADDFMLFS
jgi:Ca2+-binding RTX toxin-like protein